MSAEGNRPTHGFNLSSQDQVLSRSNIPSTSRQAIHISASNIPSTSSAPSSSSKKSNPALTIVETGQEHTGRWTREEHNAFLSALQQYGKEWKKVAAKVKTRTVVQTRTHAQKYFQKLQKGLSSEKGDVEMGTVAEAKKILPIASARRGQAQTPGQSPFGKKSRKKQERSLLATAMSTQRRQAAAATQAAAQLMTQMSQVNTVNEDQSMLSNSTAHGHGHIAHVGEGGGVFPAPSVQSGLPHPHGAPASTGVFSLGTTFAAPLSAGNVGVHSQHQHALQHQLSTHQPRQFHHQQQQQIHSQIMKIVAPQPDRTVKKNMFPEPSPAACGKRKAIELAAAQMLIAGVAAGGSSGGGMVNSGEMTRRPTPPPDNRKGELNVLQVKDGLNTVAMASARDNVGGGGSLQIINPESLPKKEFKTRNIGQDPVTPWDGQLEALSTEVKNKIEKVKSPESKPQHDESEEEARSDGNVSDDTERERSNLHQAVCRGLYDDVVKIITSHQNIGIGGIELLKKTLHALDPLGFNPLHAAVTLQDTDGMMAVKMTRLLISAGTIVTALDSFGNTPLHWAARVGNLKVIEILIFENCPLDTRNILGEMPLHWAMRSGQIGMMAVQFLLKNGARSSLFSKALKRPLDVAAVGFEGVCDDKVPIDLNNESYDDIKKLSVEDRVHLKQLCRSNLFNFSPQARTLILHHPECLEHLPKFDTDWEAPDRVNAILKTLLEDENKYVRKNEIQVSTEFDRASLEFLSRVHSAEYLTFVNNLSKELEKRHLDEQTNTDKSVPSIVPFTPMVQRTVMREPTVKKGSHSDTSFSSGSLRAARRAAGAVKHAVDCVLVGRNRNAFCITRPPGHHAGINGLLDGAESCGFCIFNNVAAGAMHALSDENNRPKCERCAIVDIDVHHGNGTEEIVKKCDHPGRLFFFSAHLYDNDKKRGKQNGFTFYPGTGDDDDVAHNVINVPIAPMWKNSASRSQSPVPENRHNTRHKSKQKAVSSLNGNTGQNKPSDQESINKSPSPDKKAEKETESFSSSRSRRNGKQQTQGSFLYGTGREAYRQSIQQRLLPALRAFNPDLILLSMGVDACRGDVGNARHYRNGRQLQGIDLTPDDYAWTTSKIMEVADICCQGRVVSVLEGGYGKPRDGNDKNDLLDKSVISECAMKHIQALVDPEAVATSEPWI